LHWANRYPSTLSKETMMKTVGLLSAAALLLASITVSYAQAASGTAPENKGNTGWTGGAADQPSQNKPGETTGQKVEIHDEAKAKDATPTASGEDLKGPPQQFAPSKTPE
jgi:hypothetical protein